VKTKVKVKRAGPKRKWAMTKATPVLAVYESFAEIAGLIAQARQRAVQSVNAALIDLYWQVGEAISRKIEVDGWGKGTVSELALYIQRQEPGIRGFSAQNLWGMRQFFDAYRVEPKLSPLGRELPWTHNLIILTQSKRPEEQEFYLPWLSRSGGRAANWKRSSDEPPSSVRCSPRQKSHQWCDKFRAPRASSRMRMLCSSPTSQTTTVSPACIAP
jgi:predicted nuclease of restriction endonuclease-like (RecB) superfamily